MSGKRGKKWLTLGRVCPRCPGRLLAVYDEGGKGLYLECDDCGLGFAGPGAVEGDVGERYQDRVVTGPVRPAIDADVIAARWDASMFSDARDA